MDPLTAGLLIGGPLLGGLIGNSQASGARQDANNARNQAIAQWAGLEAPDITQQQLLLQQYQNAGLMNPQMEGLVNQGPSALQGIALNPEMRAKQEQALSQMSQLATNGVSPSDQAVMELARRNAASESEAKQQQILQSMQSRGMGGSGAELIARLQGAQSGADRLQSANLDQAARSQQARMAATEQLGSMAGSLRGQDYGEKANTAAAQDAIARFNAANAQSVNTRNTQAQNQGQMYNVQNAQNISNQNAGIANQQQQYNKGLVQNKFNNQMNLAAGRSGQYNNAAGQLNQAAANTAGGWAQIGQGVGNAGIALGMLNKPKPQMPYNGVGPDPNYDGSKDYGGN